MPQSPLDQANRAAAGIAPRVQTPARSTLRVYAKPAADTLATLARVRDRRVSAAAARRRQAFTMPGGGGLVNPLQRGQPALRTLARDPLIRKPVGGDAGAVSLDGQMTGAIMAQFILENAAGRTAIARQIIAFVARANARHGLDALLLTALFHLEAVKDPGFQAALLTWRATIGSAGDIDGGDSGVVYDPQRQGLASADETLFRDPFAGGLALPAAVDRLQSLRGRDVSIGAFTVMVVVGLIGAAKGAFDAYQKGGSIGDVIWGAIAGAGNAILESIGGLAGKLIGFATQDTGKGTSADRNPGLVNIHTDGKGPAVVVNFGFGSKEGPMSGKDGLANSNTGKSGVDVGNRNPGGSPAGQDKDGYKDLDKGGGWSDQDKDVNKTNQTDSGDKNIDNGPKDDGNPDDHAVPPGDTGFPAPDDDGGDPWSLIAMGPMVTMSAARGMIAANRQTVFAITQIPGLSALQNGLDRASPVLGQLSQLKPGAAIAPQLKGNMANVSQAIGQQLKTNVQIGPKLNVVGQR